MANDAHVALLKQGVSVWHTWRKENSTLRPNLSEANFKGANLAEANLISVFLDKTNFHGANLRGANLSNASLNDADLSEADLRQLYVFRSYVLSAKFSKADLRGAAFEQSNMRGADLSGTDLRQAYLYRTNLSDANLREADLRQAYLMEANLYRANLNRANLSSAVLERASFIECNLENANLSGCRVYGISVWGLKLTGANQKDLVITPPDEPEEGMFFSVSTDDKGNKTLSPLFPSPHPPREPSSIITVDNLEVAQFIYLLLNNEKVRAVIDTITSKVVLILGRFTNERKRVLNALREELRSHDYLPVLFDFEKPDLRDLTETISILAHMARFVIADITNARSIPQELMAIVPSLPEVPVQPLLLSGQSEYGMFEHFRKFPWVLEPFLYEDETNLLAALKEKVIQPAETKAKALIKK
jgi:uncharacterized protein YjbI with pentapeptide repeats